MSFLSVSLEYLQYLKYIRYIKYTPQLPSILSLTYTKVMTIRKEAKTYQTIHSIRLSMQNSIREKSYLSEHFMTYFKDPKEEGAPYIKFETEPYQVSSIKKLINAMYHAEQALLIFESEGKTDAEAVGFMLRNSLTLINDGYEAMQTSAESGLELMILMKPHLDRIYKHIKEVKDLFPKEMGFKNYKIDGLEQALTIKSNASKLEKVGQLFGVVMEQANQEKPNDYALFASVISTFPNLFETAKTQLETFSKNPIYIEAGLASKNYEELTVEAERLLKAIQGINFSTLYDPTNLANYYRLVTQLLTLWNVSIIRFKELDITSHKIIKELLFKLKVSLFSPLMQIVDRIESTFLLKAGFLSDASLSNAESYYLQIVAQVDFVKFESDVLGCQVMSLVDDDFMQLRLDALRINMDEHDINEILIKEVVENAYKNLYQLLADNESDHLAEMPVDVKKEILKNYLLVQNYVRQINPTLDVSVIKFLKQARRQDDVSISGNLIWLMSRLKNYATQSTRLFDVNAELVRVKSSLSNVISQHKHTMTFQYNIEKKINQCVIIQLEKHTSQPKGTFFSSPLLTGDVNERLVEAMNTNGCISPKDYFQLYRKLENQKCLFKDAQSSYNIFVVHLGENKEIDINRFSQADKEVLRREYKKFQPFLLSFLGEKGHSLNEELVLFLNPNFKKSATAMLFSPPNQLDKAVFIHRTEKFNEKVQLRISALENQSNAVYQLGTLEHQDTDIIKDLNLLSESERAQYLVKAKGAFGLLKKVKVNFKIYLSYLDENAILSLSKEQHDGVPYPEVEDDSVSHKTPAQILAVKRLRNIVYYIESAITELGYLDNIDWLSGVKNTSGLNYIYKGLYVGCMIRAFLSLGSTYSNSNAFQCDPYLFTLEKQLFSVVGDLKEIFPVFKKEDKDVILKDDEQLDNKEINPKLALFIDCLYQLPGRIKQLSTKQPISQECIVQQSENSLDMKKRVISLVEKSNSWIKLLWALPEISKVFDALRSQLNTVSGKSYAAISENLKEIKTSCYLEIISKGASLEMQLCLKTGTIIKQSEMILDELFHSFLDKMELSDNVRLMIKNDANYFSQQGSNLEALADDITLKLKEINKKIRALSVIDKNIRKIKKSRQYLSFILSDDVIKETQEFLTNFNLIKSELKLKYKYNALKDETLKHAIIDDDDVLDEIDKLCTALNRLKLNQKATLTLEKKASVKQLQYLKEAKVLKQATFIKEIDVFLPNVYKRLLERLQSNNNKILTHLNVKYNKEMLTFLDEKKESILNSARKKPSIIEEDIERELSLLEAQFERSHLTSYQILDKIFSAIISYRKKLRSHSFNVETLESLKSKTACLAQLEYIIKNDGKSVSTRLVEIENLFEKDDFKQTISASMSYSLLSFEWFVSWYEYVLNCLYLSKSMEEQFIETIEAKLSYQSYGKM